MHYGIFLPPLYLVDLLVGTMVVAIIGTLVGALVGVVIDVEIGTLVVLDIISVAGLLKFCRSRLLKCVSFFCLSSKKINSAIVGLLVCCRHRLFQSSAVVDFREKNIFLLERLFSA